MRAATEIKTITDVMNIAVGRDHTMADYYKFVSEVVGWEIDLVYNETKPVGKSRNLLRGCFWN